MNKYPEYKDSFVSWLGHIPEHWETIKTKHVFKERVEKGYPNEPLLAATQTKGVVPKSMYENRTVEAQKDLHLLKLVEPGDFVISLRSFQGGIEYAYFRGIISPAYTLMIPQSRILPGYYRHLAKSKAFISLLRNCVTGIREGQNINYDLLKRTPIPIPPHHEQQQISRYLDWQSSKINKFIKAKKKLISLLKEQKQNIINEAVTKGINPDVKMKDSGVEWLGEIPEHWNISSIKRLASSIQTGPFGSQLHAHDYIDNGIPLINPKHIKNGKIISNPTCSISKENYQRLVKYSLRTSDLIMARRGELGRCAIVNSKENGWLCGTGSLIVRLRKGYFIENYFYLIMSSSSIAKVLSQSSIGATMENLNGTIVGNLTVPIIPLSEQSEIVNYIIKKTNIIDKTISRAEREIELIQEYRTRLVSDVVTGKVDVRSIEIPDFELVEPDLEAQDEEDSEGEGITEGIEG